jgi:AraC-like DNA-binding protein
MSFYRQYQPIALLADFIECYWVLHSPYDDLKRAERLIPGGRVEMIFNFADPIHWLMEGDDFGQNAAGGSLAGGNLVGGSLAGGVWLMGQRDRIYFARQTGATDLMGIRFKPGGLIAFTGLPASALLNSMVPAEELFGAVITEWESRLFTETKEVARISFLDTLFLKLVNPLGQQWPVVRAAVQRIRNAPEGFRIQGICEETGWYYKKLERAFLQMVGYTPKYYSRIVRFNTAIRQMSDHCGKRNDQNDGSGQKSLTGIGYAAGYYDQSHFIRDFQQFAGTTPGNFKTEDHQIAGLLISHQVV